MPLDPGTSSLLVATVSVLGFTLTVGLPTLTAVAYQALLGKGQGGLLGSFVPRFLSKFTDSGWLTFFYWTSMFYVAAVFLDIFNALYDVPPPWVFLWADLLGVGLTFLGLGALYFTVIRVSLDEVEAIQAGQRASYQRSGGETDDPPPASEPAKAKRPKKRRS